MQTTKTCSKCGIEKLISRFSSSGKKQGALRASCKDCENRRDRIRYRKEHNNVRVFQENLTDRRFGRWIIEKEAPPIIDAYQPKRHVIRRWYCRCDCGAKAIVRQCALKNGMSKSCGCLMRDLAISRMLGKNNPNFNPDLTPEERKCRNIYRNWTLKIYQRDSFTCHICGKVGKRGNQELAAHHLNGWHWHKGDRFNLSNGITLCHDCHFEFHKIYGRFNNTKEQFRKFIKQRRLPHERI